MRQIQTINRAVKMGPNLRVDPIAARHILLTGQQGSQSNWSTDTDTITRTTWLVVPTRTSPRTTMRGTSTSDRSVPSPKYRATGIHPSFSQLHHSVENGTPRPLGAPTTRIVRERGSHPTVHVTCAAMHPTTAWINPHEYWWTKSLWARPWHQFPADYLTTHRPRTTVPSTSN